MDLQQALTAVVESDDEENLSNSDIYENETSINTGKNNDSDISFDDY